MDSIALAGICILGTLGGCWLGAWVTWRCLKPGPLVGLSGPLPDEPEVDDDWEAESGPEDFDELR